jgi:hypothetical protein
MRRNRLCGGLAVLALVWAVAPAGAAVVVNWKLDETTGTTANDSAATGGAQNGTSAAASPQWQPTGGVIGGALRFTAASASDVGSNVSFTAASAIATYPLTMADWVRTSTSTTGRQTLAYLGAQTTGDQYVQTSIDPSNSTTPNRAVSAARNTTFTGTSGGPILTDGTWHHVAAVYASATNRVLYVDGVQVAASTATVNQPGATRLSIGALMRTTPTDALLSADLDDLGLWDEALTPQRIALLNGLGRFAAVGLIDPAVDAVQGVYAAQAGQASAGPLRWEYATGLPSATVGTTGTLGTGNPFIVLGTDGTGVRAVVPEPGTATAAVVLAAGGLLARRRRTGAAQPG